MSSERLTGKALEGLGFSACIHAQSSARPASGGVAASSSVVVFALACLVGLCAPAYPASAAARPSIMVLPFDFFDGSADQRPAALDAQTRLLSALPDQVNQALQDGGNFRVITSRAVRSALQKLQGEYAYPTLCGECMLKLGAEAGADYVVVGQVRKVSNLIIYLQAEVDGVRTHQVVDQVLLEVKADNPTMLRRAAPLGV